jgi:hypothetical protein
MRGFRLNGWQRIGIVLSVIWAIWAVFHEMDESLRRYNEAYGEAFGPVYRECRDKQDREGRPADGRACLEEAEPVAMKTVHMESRWNVAIVALAPIPIAWLLVWGLVALVRWIRRGFQPSA